MNQPSTAVDLAAERAAHHTRLDEKAGRTPREVVPLPVGEAEGASRSRPDLRRNRYTGGAKLSTEQQAELLKNIREMLENDPEMAGAEVYRRLQPAITYPTFMNSYFPKAIHARPKPRHEPRQEKPAPSASRPPAVEPGAPPLRLPFALGSIEGTPLGDGDYDITVRLPRLTERNFWALLEMLRPMLTPAARDR